MKHIFIILIFIVVLTGCESGDVIIVKCDTPANLTGQDHTYSVCGGHFLFKNEDTGDTILIGYNSVLRDYFQTNSYDDADYPLPVYIEYTDLPGDDGCREYLKEIICIRKREEKK